MNFVLNSETGADRTNISAGTAQQAHVELVLHPLRILDHFVGQVFQERDLAPGHVALIHALGKHRTNGLAHAALHARDHLVVELVQHFGQLMNVCSHD